MEVPGASERAPSQYSRSGGTSPTAGSSNTGDSTTKSEWERVHHVGGAGADRHKVDWTKSALRVSNSSKARRPLSRYFRPFLIGVALAIGTVGAIVLFRYLRARAEAIPLPPREVLVHEIPPPLPVVPVEIPPHMRLTWSSRPPRVGESSAHILRSLGGTKAVFHGESPMAPGYTPPFEPAPGETFACVNAGNNELWIGGGGINGEMARQLLLAAKRSGVLLSPARLSDITARLHSQALQKARANPGELVELDPSLLPLGNPFKRVFAFVSRDPQQWSDDTAGANVSAVFIDELRESFRPHGDRRNAYVVYTVSPHGRAPTHEFNAAYQQTYRNIIEAVTRFNVTAAGERRIRRLRIPLLSSGIFAAGRSIRELSAQMMGALASALGKQGTQVQLEFAWSGGDGTFTAAQQLEEQ